MKNIKVKLGEYMEFLGKDALSITDLEKWWDGYAQSYYGLPKVIVMDKLRQAHLFPWGAINKAGNFIKINGKVHDNVLIYKGIPIVESL